MTRTARVVLSDIPHHATQRCDDRAQTLFCEEDRGIYFSLLANDTLMAVALAGAAKPNVD